MSRRGLWEEGEEGGKQGGAPRPVPSAEELLLQCRDLASGLRLLRADCLHMGLELLRLIQERVRAILQHSTQVGRPALGSTDKRLQGWMGIRRPGVRPHSQTGRWMLWILPLNPLAFPTK